MDLTRVNEKRKKRIEDYYTNKIKNAELLIDNVWDPHNVAAIARTADGLGIERINLYYTYNKFPNLKKVGKKSSSSANKWIRFERIGDLDSFICGKKQEGWKVFGACFKPQAKDLRKQDFSGKVLLVFGSEKNGLSEEIEKICDDFVFIPLTGMVESYNVSVAAAIFMYELFRQRGEGLKLRN